MFATVCECARSASHLCVYMFRECVIARDCVCVCLGTDNKLRFGLRQTLDKGKRDEHKKNPANNKQTTEQSNVFECSNKYARLSNPNQLACMEICIRRMVIILQALRYSWRVHQNLHSIYNIEYIYKYQRVRSHDSRMA